MTFVSSTDACHRLGIDAKTLRRWLQEAHLSLQDHAHDRRKKGISSEHLDLLAHLHHRSLAPLPPPAPPTAANALPSLPAAFLALPDMVCALQAQIAALQQHVADLTALLLPPAPTPPPTRAKRPSPVPSSRSTTTATPKTPPKSTHVIPRVEYGNEGHYVVICPKHGLLSFEPDTPPWFAWVATQSSFRFVGKEGHFTAHHEWTTPRGAWRAHRQIRNHSYNLRLASSQSLTITVLEQAALALQAHLT